MRKISYIFFLCALFTANVFAATVSISRTIPTKNDEAAVEQKSENTNIQNRSARNVSRTVSRPVPKNEDVVARKTVNVVSRSVNNRTSAKSPETKLDAAVNTVGRSARTESASINNTAALRRAGITLRASTAEVGGRATIGNTGIQTGSNIDEQVRGVKGRAALSKTKTVTAESLAEAKDLMEKTNELNSVCQQQYNECMDQFCAVVDANQKRCSCSANLARYAKVQEAVEKANSELNDVAQNIRYVGLSADEIRAIMSATEAELAMTKTKDNTENRSMLDDILDMVQDPTSTTTLTDTDNNLLGMDMNFDFSSDSADMFSVDLFNNNNQSDISSKRGTALYKEATKRCKSVIAQCKDAGGTESQITGNYDLAIAKDCIAYEQGLEKLNTTLVNNVRSANMMLQKARLAVLQNKNEYDIKGCIGALEKCMYDDMVCGENYVKCLDPTKKYIDENGNVVLGRNIANITDFMTEYNNTKINADFIKASASDISCPNHDGACIVNYLMKKIGTGATVKDGGLCRAVLDKCQYYTYDSNTKQSKYKPYNEVVVGYIQRAMVNIKAAQSKIVSDYASTCMNEVEACYNQQNTQITSWSSSANVDNIYKVMTGACYNVALTCGYAVFAYDKEMGEEIRGLDDDKDQKLKLINGISQMFYETMLCPENSEFISDDTTVLVGRAMVNDRCACKKGYVLSNGACVTACSTDQFAINGVCQKWIEPTTSCPSGANDVYFDAVFVNGVWRPKNCLCDGNRWFSMSYIHPATGYVGLCDKVPTYASSEYCSSRDNNTIAEQDKVPSEFNEKTRACDCPSGSSLVEERCRPNNGNVVKAITACYAIDCVRNPTATEQNKNVEMCEVNGQAKKASSGDECNHVRFANGFQYNCKYNETTKKVDCK
nr:hypothetical protein [Candidatus Enterousia merdequi]